MRALTATLSLPPPGSFTPDSEHCRACAPRRQRQCPTRRNPDVFVDLRVSARPSPLLDAKGGWVKPCRLFTTPLSCFSQVRPLGCCSMPPSRQERRRAERAAAKAPAKAGAAGTAAARAHVNGNPVGDWKTQTEDPSVFQRSDPRPCFRGLRTVTGTRSGALALTYCVMQLGLRARPWARPADRHRRR